MTHKLIVLGLTLMLTACSVGRIPESVSTAILNNPDLDVVEQGLPAYLLTIDGLVLNYPQNASLLATSSTLNGSYATLFVTEPERRKRIVNKAYDHAVRSYCETVKKHCDLKSLPFDEFETVISGLQKEQDFAALYLLGTSWASMIQENTDDWNAIADLAKVQYIMERIVELDESYDHGQGLLYLGVLNSLIPPSLGGKPEVARGYFDKAIEVTEGKNLYIKVMYAQQYARMMFDQELHDELLRSVIDSNPEVEDLWLQNVYAQKQAAVLLAESVEYF